MDPLILITAGLVALSAVLTTVGFRSVAAAYSDRIDSRLARRGTSSSGAAASVTIQQTSRGIFASLDRPLSKLNWAQRMRLNLKQADVNLHVSEFIFLRLLLSVGGGLAIAVIGASLLTTVAGLIIGLMTWFVAGRWVAARIEHRRRRLEGQLDSALLGLATSLKSGFGFLQACQLSLDQLEWPLEDEIEDLLEDVSLGSSIDDALRAMAERVHSYEMDLMVNAILVQRSVGGDVGNTLENIARTLRERRELNGHIMSLTAQQRLSAYFVSGLPVLVGAFLSLTSWEFMRPLFTTQTGQILIGFGIVFDILGFLAIRRLTKIDF